MDGSQNYSDGTKMRKTFDFRTFNLRAHSACLTFLLIYFQPNAISFTGHLEALQLVVHTLDLEIELRQRAQGYRKDDHVNPSID